jgi:DNA-binding NtrC family response regulator
MNTGDTVGTSNDPAAACSGTSILVVDDEPGNRETLADILTGNGYRAETAATGREALDKVRDRFFDGAILDVRLPDMFGTEVLAQLKQLHPDTACLIITGYASLQSSLRALDAGAAAYLIKPVQYERLITVLEQALERQHRLLEDRRLLQQCQERIRDLEAREAQLSERIRHLEGEHAASHEPRSEGGPSVSDR